MNIMMMKKNVFFAARLPMERATIARMASISMAAAPINAYFAAQLQQDLVP